MGERKRDRRNIMERDGACERERENENGERKTEKQRRGRVCRT